MQPESCCSGGEAGRFSRMSPEIAKFLVTTVRRGAPLRGSGDLMEVNLQEETARVLISVPSPVYPRVDAQKVFGGKRGFRGVRVRDGEIFVATFDSVLVLNLDGTLAERLTHRLFSDIHGIELDGDDLFVTSTGIDALIRVNLRDRTFHACPMRSILLQADESDSHIIGGDHRRHVRTDMRIHPNYVWVAGESLWVTCRALGTIVEMTKQMSCPREVLPRNTLDLPHDGRVKLTPRGAHIHVTETGRSCVTQFITSDHGERRIHRACSLFAGAMNPALPPSRGRTSWARGLFVLPDGSLVFGQSPGRLGLHQPNGQAKIWQLDGHPSSAIFDVVPFHVSPREASKGEWRPLLRLAIPTHQTGVIGN